MVWQRGRNRGYGREQPASPSGFNNALSLASAQDLEVNADLQERFTLNNSYQTDAEERPLLVLNTNIRQYAATSQKIAASENEGFFLPEVPSSEELLRKKDPDDFEYNNITNGAWSDKETYFENQYHLLREDTVRPLREAVLTFSRTPMMKDDKDIAIYEKVHIIGVTFAAMGVGIRVRFSIARAGKKIKWENSKRLISGSIVALTPASDNFRSKCIVAIVAARPLDGVRAQPPEIDLFFGRTEDIEIDPQTQFTMIEARSGYFEASRHTMKALQKLSTERFPFSEHIIDLKTNIEPPRYLTKSPKINIATAYTGNTEHPSDRSVDVLREWPEVPLNSSLDASQWKALHRMLTTSLSIVQGPPGTGKTFVSIAALKVLLANKADTDPPIVISAMTNHALDQLLRHVAKTETNFIRLGGRSTDDEIKRQSIFEVRQRNRVPPIRGSILGRAAAEQKALWAKMINTLSPLITERDSPAPLFNASFFQELGLLSSTQVDSLVTGAVKWTQADTDSVREENAMALWLDKSISPFEATYAEDTFGFEQEDEEVDEEFEQLKELEAEQGIDEDDFETLRGPYKSIVDFWTVSRGCNHTASAMAQKHLDNNKDLWKIPQAIRGAVYAYLKRTAKERLVATFRAQAQHYAKVCQDLQVGKFERDAVILKSCKVIGLTTTGLSKYRALVSSLKPKIVLIEEAAECLEGTIAVACMESLEHLVLVGDHQQLRPSNTVSQLGGPPFNLNTSLFERLVQNSLPFDTLSRQRRMDPEFRRLLAPIYKNLEDHDSVLNRPPPPGMAHHKSWLFSHQWPESTDDSFSKLNEREALMIAKFFSYLVLNGTPIHGITVLCFYNAQRKRILKELRQNERLASSYLNVVTVDSYQGEENGVVILSLTRNNDGKDERSIGFCGIANRVCVALSRARLGFYIFGSGSQLYAASPLWRDILTIMISEPKRVGYELPLTCRKHRREIKIKEPEDFDKFNAGCELKCPDKLECGHECPELCHPYTHKEIFCKKKCEKSLPCGHACKKLCGVEECLCHCEAFAATTGHDGIPDSASASVSDPPAINMPQATTAMTTRPWPRRNESGRPPFGDNRRPHDNMNPVVRAQYDQRVAWNTYAGGRVKDDDKHRAKAAEREEHEIIKQRSRHAAQDMDLLDIGEDYEKSGASTWKDATNLTRNMASSTLADGIISETRREVSDGHGGVRTRYRHEYLPPIPQESVATWLRGLDGNASSESSQPAVNLMD